MSETVDRLKYACRLIWGKGPYEIADVKTWSYWHATGDRSTSQLRWLATATHAPASIQGEDEIDALRRLMSLGHWEASNGDLPKVDVLGILESAGLALEPETSFKRFDDAATVASSKPGLRVAAVTPLEAVAPVDHPADPPRIVFEIDPTPPAVTGSPVKLDAGKSDMSLVQWRAFSKYVDVLTFGARKYVPNGWAKQTRLRARCMAGALRHVVAYMRGERVDPETQLPTLAHAICDLMIVLEHDEGGPDVLP